MKRIDFLKNLGLGVLVLTVPIAVHAEQKEKLYLLAGNGKEDDSEALQAWIDGKTVYWKYFTYQYFGQKEEKHYEITGDQIQNRTFKLTKTITNRNAARKAVFVNCKFVFYETNTMFLSSRDSNHVGYLSFDGCECSFHDNTAHNVAFAIENPNKQYEQPDSSKIVRDASRAIYAQVRR